MENIIAIHFGGKGIFDFYISKYSLEINEYEILSWKDFSLLDFGEEIITLFEGKKIICIDPVDTLYKFNMIINNYFGYSYKVWKKLNINLYSFFDFLNNTEIKSSEIIEKFYNQFFLKLSNFKNFEEVYKFDGDILKLSDKQINTLNSNNYIDLLETIYNAEINSFNIINRNRDLNDKNLLRYLLQYGKDNSEPKKFLIFEFRKESNLECRIDNIIELPKAILIKLYKDTLLADICLELHKLKTRFNYKYILFLKSQDYFKDNKKKLRMLKYASCYLRTPLFILYNN